MGISEMSSVVPGQIPRPNGYEGPEPATNVEEFKAVVFKKTRDRKQYFRDLCQNEYWITVTSKNLFLTLDKNHDGSLQLDEIKPVLMILVRRACKIVMGFSWGLGPVIKRQSKIVYNKMIPFSSSSDGIDLLNLQVSIRNSLLFCSGESGQKEVEEISNHFYRRGRIDYSVLKLSQIAEQ